MIRIVGRVRWRVVRPTLALHPADRPAEKLASLHANLGGHAGTPWFEVDDGARFFARHLK